MRARSDDATRGQEHGKRGRSLRVCCGLNASEAAWKTAESAPGVRRCEPHPADDGERAPQQIPQSAASLQKLRDLSRRRCAIGRCIPQMSDDGRVARNPRRLEISRAHDRVTAPTAMTNSTTFSSRHASAFASSTRSAMMSDAPRHPHLKRRSIGDGLGTAPPTPVVSRDGS